MLHPLERYSMLISVADKSGAIQSSRREGHVDEMWLNSPLQQVIATEFVFWIAFVPKVEAKRKQ